MKYRDYRACGVDPITAFTLSINPWLFYGSAALVGAPIGIFWSQIRCALISLLS